MPTVEVKLEVDHESVSQLSTDNPDREFSLFDYKREETGCHVVLTASGLAPETVLPYFEKDSDVLEYEVIHTEDDVSAVRFSIETPPAHQYRAIFTMTPRSPPTVQRGWINATIEESREGLDSFLALLREGGIHYQVISITESNTPTELLTTRQREVVRAAIDQGYYEIPKSCTLAEIADSLDSHKSTIGGVLNRAEGRIITAFMRERSS